jgi:hypothetical protein
MPTPETYEYFWLPSECVVEFGEFVDSSIDVTVNVGADHGLRAAASGRHSPSHPSTVRFSKTNLPTARHATTAHA